MESRPINRYLFLTTEDIIKSRGNQPYYAKLIALQGEGLTFVDGQFTYFLTETSFYLYEGKLDVADPVLSCCFENPEICGSLYENLIQFYCQNLSIYSLEDFFHLHVDSEIELLVRQIIQSHLAQHTQVNVDVERQSSQQQEKEMPVNKLAGLEIEEKIYGIQKKIEKTSTVVLNHVDRTMTSQKIYDLLMSFSHELNGMDLRCELKNDVCYLHSIKVKEPPKKQANKKSNQKYKGGFYMNWWHHKIDRIKKLDSINSINSSNLLFALNKNHTLSVRAIKAGSGSRTHFWFVPGGYEYSQYEFYSSEEVFTLLQSKPLQAKLTSLQLNLEKIDGNVYLSPFSQGFSDSKFNHDQWQCIINIITANRPSYADLIKFEELAEPLPCLELSSFIWPLDKIQCIIQTFFGMNNTFSSTLCSEVYLPSYACRLSYLDHTYQANVSLQYVKEQLRLLINCYPQVIEEMNRPSNMVSSGPHLFSSTVTGQPSQTESAFKKLRPM